MSHPKKWNLREQLDALAAAPLPAPTPAPEPRNSPTESPSVGELHELLAELVAALVGPDPDWPRHLQLAALLDSLRSHRRICALIDAGPNSAALWEAFEETEALLAAVQTALARVTLEAPHG